MWKVWFKVVNGKNTYVGKFEKEYATKANACKLAKKLEKATGYEMVASIENPFVD